MLSKKIQINNLKFKKNQSITNILSNLLKEKNQTILSLGNKYKNKYSYKKLVNKVDKLNVRIFGMGGSILGAKAIYDFLKDKIKKKFFFIDNINEKISFNNKKKFLDLVISKS